MNSTYKTRFAAYKKRQRDRDKKSQQRNEQRKKMKIEDFEQTDENQIEDSSNMK